MSTRTVTAVLIFAIGCFIVGAALAIFGDSIWWRLLGVILYAPAISLTIWSGRAVRARRNRPDGE